MTILRLSAGLLVLVGGYLIQLSYPAYAKWQEYMALGDASGAELYQVEFRMTAAPGVLILFLGAFLFGVSVAKRQRKA